MPVHSASAQQTLNAAATRLREIHKDAELTASRAQ